jgi:galactokinase
MESRGVLARLHAFHRRVHGREPELVVSVPGRLDFLNTHQDYKGLPVVGMAVNRRLYLAVSRGRRRVRIASLNLMEEGGPFVDEFSPENPRLRGGKWFGDYARAGVRALRSAGYGVAPASISVASEIPVGAGMASSAALTVAVVYGLAAMEGNTLPPGEAAELAYVAERRVMGIPCGRLDQYTIAYGGVVLVRTREPVGVERLGEPRASIIVADSGIRHSTGEIHPARQGELNEALRLLKSSGNLPGYLESKLGDDYASTEWDAIGSSVLDRVKPLLPSRLYKRLAYTVLAHESTVEAVKLLRGEKASRDRLGEWAREVDRWVGRRVYGDGPESRERALGLVATYQHCLLSRLYEVSLERLDEMVRILVTGGALGAKLSGAGMGGVVMGLAEESVVHGLAGAVKASGSAAAVHVVRVDGGAMIH